MSRDTAGFWRGGFWHLSKLNAASSPEVTFAYGLRSDVPIVGDWDCDGYDSVGVFRDGAWYLNNNNDGSADRSVYFGVPGDLPLVGDWDGDGCDSIGIRRNGMWHLNNQIDSSPSDLNFAYGLAADRPLIGDWDCNGTETVGVWRGGWWFLNNQNDSSAADLVFAYGSSTDLSVTGDWARSGCDSVGVFRGGAWHLNYQNDSSAADASFAYGQSGDTPIAGGWFTLPAATTSRYMSTLDTGVLYNLGCAAGARKEDGTAVLDFGQPWWDGSTYGTTLFNNTFAPISGIETAVRGWLGGYWDCSPSGTYIRLAVGTSNYRGATESGHGQAWAQLVNRLNSWIISPPSWASQLGARGAIDIEPEWNSASASRGWAEGYNLAGLYPYYNFGSAGGCPPYGSCNNGWTQADVRYVSWSLSLAYPLPQIYCRVCYAGDPNGGNAAQWQALSLFSHLNYGQRMFILGSLTQWAAASFCCTNNPAQGWQQLYDRLNSDPRTSQDLQFATDITWGN